MFPPFRSSQRKLGTITKPSEWTPTFAGMSGMVACLLLVSCATTEQSILKSSAYIEKQKIAEQTKSSKSMNLCPVQPGPYENPLDAYSYKLLTDSRIDPKARYEKVEEQINSFAKRVSFSSEFAYTIWCWDGSYFTAAQIGELRDLNKTWLQLYVGYGDMGAKHKCAYAKDPNAWTTEACPAKSYEGAS